MTTQRSLPSGTLTFLFTDIEGSTAHWERHPQAMQAALVRHDAILRAALESNGGHIYKLIGDAFCAAFPVASEALVAAVAAQQALVEEEWDASVGALKVRMGLHTCSVEARGGDYVGPGLNRMARMLAVAYGGQTLLSLVTAEMVKDNLPSGCRLLDLGERRLKDLVRPERIYQLAAPGLPLDFPPLKTLDLYPHNLPAQLSSFVGREKEMAEVKGLLKVTHLLTLVGSGGTGKTRLALQAGADQIENFRDGVWFIELASLTDPALVAGAVAQALHLQEVANQTLEETLLEYLREKQLLLILDNCEHLVEVCAQLSQRLLQGCPNLRILATSREGLEIAGETTYRVPSLLLPDIKNLPSTLEALTQYEAVRLFIDRAMAAHTGFLVNNQNAPALAQICYRLDGIPLAIELAAARVRAMSLEQIEARLNDRFRLLTGGSRTALPRHQTLKAAIDWSYELLPEIERLVLRRLAVFAGSWSLEAAEAVCAGEGVEDYEVLDPLQQLVNKSLISVEEQGEARRYRMLETVRQYSWERLQQAGEEVEVRTVHRDWYLELIERAEPHLWGKDEAVWFDLFELEHDNLRAALDWSTDRSPEEEGLRLGAALWHFWEIRAYYTEGLNWLKVMLQKSMDTPTLAQARAYSGAGTMAWLKGDFGQASWLHQASLDLSRQVGDKVGEAFALNNLGAQFYSNGDYRAANLLFKESLTLSREIGNERVAAYALVNLGESARCQADLKSAKTYIDEGLALIKKMGDISTIAFVLYLKGLVEQNQGNFEQAISIYNQSIALSKEVNNKRYIILCLEGLAGVFVAKNQPLRAARLFGVVEALREAISFPIVPTDLEEFNFNLASIRNQLEEQVFEKTWAVGRAMSLEQAITYGLEDRLLTVEVKE